MSAQTIARPMGVSKRDNRTQDILMEVVAVSFLATGGIFVKLSALDPINTGFYRVLFSLPLLLPLAHKRLRCLSARDAAMLFAAGVFLAGDIALWNLSFSYTSVANANLLTNLVPFTVIPVSWFLFKEKMPKYFLVGALITLLGVFVLLGGKVNPSPENYFGDFLSFCASFFYAGFLLIAYRLRDRLKSNVIMLVSGFGCAAALFVSAFWFEGIQVPRSLEELWPLVALTVCLQLVGHTLLAHCQGKININLSSIICLLQPAIALVYSLIVFGERVSWVEVAGIAIVIVGVYLVKLQYSR